MLHNVAKFNLGITNSEVAEGEFIVEFVARNSVNPGDIRLDNMSNGDTSSIFFKFKNNKSGWSRILSVVKIGLNKFKFKYSRSISGLNNNELVSFDDGIRRNLSKLVRVALIVRLNRNVFDAPLRNINEQISYLRDYPNVTHVMFPPDKDYFYETNSLNIVSGVFYRPTQLSVEPYLENTKNEPLFKDNFVSRRNFLDTITFRLTDNVYIRP